MVDVTAPLPDARREGDVLVRREAHYRMVDGFRPLALDLHVPATPGTDAVPLLVFVHGGAFRFGHRTLLPPVLAGLFQDLPAQGVAVATVDYRLSGEALWPACVDDVRHAVTWLRDRAGELGLDADRVALWGESAGGYLSLAAGLSLAADGVPVRGIVDWYGPIDFSTMAAQGAPWTDGPDSPESLLLGAPVRTVPDLVAEANPCRLLTPDSPPILIMHGTADRAIPYEQALQLRQACREAGVTHTLVPVEGGGHGFPGGDSASLTEPVTSFFRAVLARVPSGGH